MGYRRALSHLECDAWNVMFHGMLRWDSAWQQWNVMSGALHPLSHGWLYLNGFSDFFFGLFCFSFWGVPMQCIMPFYVCFNKIHINGFQSRTLWWQKCTVFDKDMTCKLSLVIPDRSEQTEIEHWYYTWTWLLKWCSGCWLLLKN